MLNELKLRCGVGLSFSDVLGNVVFLGSGGGFGLAAIFIDCPFAGDA